MTLAELKEQRDSLLADLDNPGDADVDELAKRANELADQIKAENDKADRAKAARDALTSVRPQDVRIVKPAAAAPEEADNRDLASRFVQSDGVQEYRTRGAHGKVAMEFDGSPAFSTRSLIDNTSTSGGAFQRPAFLPMVNQSYLDRDLHVADLLTKGTTGNNSVDYVEDTSAAGAGSPAETAEGSAKPESTYTFSQKTAAVRTIAHWLNITRQTLDDNAQLESYIRTRMVYGLEYRLDSQLLNGNGTAPNLRGLLNTSGIATQAPGSAEARVITIRKAITTAMGYETAPTGVVLNPADWELVELSADANGMFRVSPNRQDAAPPRIWGLQVVSTTAIASGTGLVGDFKRGATLWDRQQPALLITDSHASNFVSNILTLLAELRVALTVFVPKAFVAITFNGTT